jgi:uncharacterized protein DUF5994
VTTIRVTRRSPTTPDDAEAPTGRPGTVRLELIDPRASHSTLDGAWWPRTTDLGTELAPLLEELSRRGIRATRVAFNPDSWAEAPRRLRVGDRTVRLGWFRHLDPHLLNLTGDLRRGRVDLLVVPPDSTRTTARRAFSAATDRTNDDEPSVLLHALDAADPTDPDPDAPEPPRGHPDR